MDTVVYKKLKFDPPKDPEKFLSLLAESNFEELHNHFKTVDPLRKEGNAVFLKPEVIDFFHGVALWFQSKPLNSTKMDKFVNEFFKGSDMIIFLLSYWSQNLSLFDDFPNSKRNQWLLIVSLPSPKLKLYPMLKSEYYQDIDFAESKRIKLVEGIWLKQIYRGVPQDVFLQVVKKLVDEIMGLMSDPELLGDFFVNFVEKKDTKFGIFALEGVAKLMLEKSFSYPAFFDILYEKLPALSCFPAKETRDFIFKLNMFMGSTHVPAYTIAAFAKRIARVAIVSEVEVCNLLIGVLRNMFANHAIVQEMCHREQPANLESDPYIENVPLKDANANESSLWELGIIFRHWQPQTVKKVDFIEINAKTSMDTAPLQTMTKSELFKKYFDQGAKKIEDCPISFKKLDDNILYL